MVFVTFKPDGVHTNQAHPEPKAVLPDITVSSDEESRLNQVQIKLIKEDGNSYSASHIKWVAFMTKCANFTTRS